MTRILFELSTQQATSNGVHPNQASARVRRAVAATARRLQRDHEPI